LTPTYTVDLARMIWRLVGEEANGLYHVTSAGSCSWYEFAKSIFQLSGLSTAVRPIRTASLGAIVRRPAYSVLAKARLISEGYDPLPEWTEGLKRYLEAARVAANAKSTSTRIGATYADR
jgi:dTDP-4-dehydrorhamnose reductase